MNIKVELELELEKLLEEGSHLEDIILTTYNEDGKTHLNGRCRDLRGKVENPVNETLEELLGKEEGICQACGPELIEIVLANYHQWQPKFQEISSLLDSLTLENLSKAKKIARDLNVENLHPWMTRWFLNELMECYLWKLNTKVEQHREQLQLELAADLGLGAQTQTHIIAESTWLSATLRDKYGDLLTILYGQPGPDRMYFILPENYKKIMKPGTYTPLGNFTPTQRQITKRLMADGGIYQDVTKAAKAAMEL